MPRTAGGLCGGALFTAVVGTMGAKFVWDNYEKDLRASGDFFYTWQYDLRWAGDGLVKEGKLDKTSHRGTWERLG